MGKKKINNWLKSEFKKIPQNNDMNDKANILIVDDDERNLLSLEQILIPLGEKVTKARSGIEALRLVLKEDFALIFLDVKMPEMDGLEAAALLRKKKKSREIPIIFVTGYDKSDSTIFKGYELGAVDYLIKPIKAEIVLSKARVFVDLYKKEHVLQSKSEFLANMSHELRTPLNSILVLSKILSKNKRGNLNSEDIEHANIIHSAGSDLLDLINDVLDHAKLESGKFEIEPEWVGLKSLINEIIRRFKWQFEAKGVDLNSNLHKNMPEFIYTDSSRLEQILKNLVSNALKFTESGSVTIKVFPSDKKTGDRPASQKDTLWVGFTVADTGIGIAKNKQKKIFKAFTQVDGSISKKFGGTGLGLSISKGLCQKLYGEITLRSQEGKGSEFTLLLPEKIPSHVPIPMARSIEIDAPIKPISPILLIEDDREDLREGPKLALIISSDEIQSKEICEISRECNYQILRANSGATGIHDANEFFPDIIFLDLDLHDTNSLSVLDQIKSNLRIRHIPVFAFSKGTSDRVCLAMGAVEVFQRKSKENFVGALTMASKISIKRKRRALLVESKNEQKKSVKDLFPGVDLACLDIEQIELNSECGKSKNFDYLILDIDLEKKANTNLLKKFLANNATMAPVPVIAFTANQLKKTLRSEIELISQISVFKNPNTLENLFSDVTLFSHIPANDLPLAQQKLLKKANSTGMIFQSRKILVVDDDVRNTYVIRSIFQDTDAKLIFAANGKDSLNLLEVHPDIDIILMDIMMPEMDGYEAITKIRKSGLTTPVIALTAKTMKGDREKSLEVGANDYLSKPFKQENLLSTCRIWLK